MLQVSELFPASETIRLAVNIHNYRKGLIRIRGVERDKNGNWERTEEIQIIVIVMDVGGNRINVDTPVPGANPAGFANAMQGMIDKKLTWTLNPKREVVRINGVQALGAQLGQGVQWKQFLEQVISEESFRIWASQLLVPLPKQAVNKGTQWKDKRTESLNGFGDLTINSTYTYAGPTTVGEQIDETMKIQWTAPKNFNLPFKVVQAKLNP